MLALLWIAAISVSAMIAGTTGVPVISVALVAGCVVMLWHFLSESADILDPRAGFFLAVLLFLALPNLVLAYQFGREGMLFHSTLVRRLVVERADFERVQLLLALGIASVSAGLLLSPRVRLSDRDGEPYSAGRLVLLVYTVTVIIASALTFAQFGSFTALLVSAINPVARLANASSRGGSGISGILVFIVTMSAYYLCRGLRHRSVGLPLFLPAIVMVLPLANRGTIVEILMIMALAVSDLKVRAPFAILVGAALLLPPFAGALVAARNNTFGAAGDFSVEGLYRGFADDSPMVAVFAMTLGALRRGAVDYTYGLDLIMFPLWYVPRLFWPTKPMPLDFRLNAALGLNDGIPFGTPIGLFGGVFMNFTLLAYVPVLWVFGWSISSLYGRFRNDRLVLLLFFVFVIDIVRVGDLSRELVTLSVGLFAVWFVRRFAERKSVLQSPVDRPGLLGAQRGALAC
ncbi:MAG: hypothetical protein ABJE47_06390 [bacterium]